MTDRTRKPQAFALADGEAPASGRRKAPRDPKTIPLSRVEFEEEAAEGDFLALQHEPRLTGRGFRWASLFLTSLAILVSLRVWLSLGSSMSCLPARSSSAG
jgi:hypothetical protein